jgi:hypothetical protein
LGAKSAVPTLTLASAPATAPIAGVADPELGVDVGAAAKPDGAKPDDGKSAPAAAAKLEDDGRKTSATTATTEMDEASMVMDAAIDSFCVHYGHLYRLLCAGKQSVRTPRSMCDSEHLH